MYGGFFTPEDVKSANKVIVLGANVSDQLFGEGVDPTDTIIRVRNHVFKVLGVMARKGAAAGGMQNQDDQSFAPYTTVMKKLSGQQNLNRILASARTADDVAAGQGVDRSDASPDAPDHARATRTTSRSRPRKIRWRSARRPRRR